MSKIIDAINQENLKETVPQFNVGDTVKVMVKVIEGTRERLQAFEGVCIAKKGGGIGECFTVRRMSFGVGVERTFPIHSPKIADILVVRKGKTRRAKLYYLRGRTGKAAKVKEQNNLKRTKKGRFFSNRFFVFQRTFLQKTFWQIRQKI